MDNQHITRKTTQPSPVQGDRAVRGHGFANVSYPLQTVARGSKTVTPSRLSQSYTAKERYALAERLDVSRVSTSAYPGNTS